MLDTTGSTFPRMEDEERMVSLTRIGVAGRRSLDCRAGLGPIKLGAYNGLVARRVRKEEITYASRFETHGDPSLAGRR